MKIVFLSPSYTPRIGGVEKHTRRIAEELVKQGHDVLVITSKHENHLPDRGTINGVRVVRFSFPAVKIIGLLVIWVRIFKLRELFKDADIVHIHDVFIWYLPLRFLLRKKVFITHHGWEGVYPVPLKNKLIKKISNRLVHGSIAIGKYIEKYYGLRADKVIYGGVDMPGKIPKKKNEIVFLGRLEEDTGVVQFIKLLNYFKASSVIFCGDGKLRAICEEKGRVVGFVNPAPYLKSAKYCFVGGYLSALEALANKCIVFASYPNPLKRDYFSMSPIKDYISYSKTGSFDQTKAESGFKWARKQTWNKATKAYLDLWQDVL